MTERDMRIRPGSPAPLGATWQGDGTNFALFSAHAARVELCLFETDDQTTPSHVIELPERTTQVWHGFVPDVGPGTRYGYRVHGSFDAERGLRFNGSKLLLDPYARAIDGTVTWDESVYSYDFADPEDDLSLSDVPNDAWVPKSVVVDPAFDWGDDHHPRHAWSDTIIYEAHVKGFSERNTAIPEELRGTYAGLAHPASIAHLTELGVTTLELLPVHAFVDDAFLATKGLRNYWGYSTLGFFAPEARYAAPDGVGSQVTQFKEMVKALHAAGIEVILDVVFNHSCEGNHLGPTLSFRGIDNPTYYRLLPDKPRYYMDLTGTGNTMNIAHPQVLKLVTDSLRYWVEDMHVDGFRFDLASTLGREMYDFDPRGGFFDAVHQDPVLSRVKLIAEPWDVGEGGYQVGNFPLIWSEWNDRFRDGVRAIWQGDNAGPAEIANRIAGSSDLYQASGRDPRASINVITTHDGFTLNDLVTYAEKHNEANGEDNRDGHDHNISANYGIEGPTDDLAITDLRERQKRNMLAMLFLSLGVPMLCGGDEIGRTQQGNNNAYCQDNEISWLDWELDDCRQDLLAYVQTLTTIRRERPLLRRHRFFEGRPLVPDGLKDIAWFRPEGPEMVDGDWSNPAYRAIAIRLAGDALKELDENGDPIEATSLLILLNAHEGEVTFSLPTVDRGSTITTWQEVLNTDDPRGAGEALHAEGDAVVVPGRTVILCEARERGSVS